MSQAIQALEDASGRAALAPSASAPRGPGGPGGSQDSRESGRHHGAQGGVMAAVLVAISASHLINDLLQSLIPAIYPILKARFALSFGQIGAITLVNQITASVLQPCVGHVTDKRPMPYSLAAGMGSTLIGLALLARAQDFVMVLAAVALVGIGSSIFHPESSRVARLASGGQHGLAQAIFQVGGNAGAALGPLLAAFVVTARSLNLQGEAAAQGRIAWFTLVALIGIGVLAWVGRWYRRQLRAPARRRESTAELLPRWQIMLGLAVLSVLMLSKFFYTASMSNYYTFFLIHRFGAPVRTAQICLFVYLASFAAGTLLGGPVGDRIGRRAIIWISILGVLPFTLLLPHLGFYGTVLDTVPIGLLLASAFPAIVVYAQELMPGRIGTVSGLMFGLAFGLGGLGAAALGMLADRTSIGLVFDICSLLPLLGMAAALLPRR